MEPLQVGDWVRTPNGMGRITLLKTVSAFVDMDAIDKKTGSSPVEYLPHELTKIDLPTGKKNPPSAQK